MCFSFLWNNESQVKTIGEILNYLLVIELRTCDSHQFAAFNVDAGDSCDVSAQTVTNHVQLFGSESSLRAKLVDKLGDHNAHCRNIVSSCPVHAMGID